MVPDRAAFLAEMSNYMRGGVVASMPTMFLMAKPVRQGEEPDDQWGVADPDTWFIRWAAGKGSMGMMMSLGKPLEFVSFRRFNGKKETALRTYKWADLLKRISRKA